MEVNLENVKTKVSAIVAEGNEVLSLLGGGKAAAGGFGFDVGSKLSAAYKTMLEEQAAAAAGAICPGGVCAEPDYEDYDDGCGDPWCPMVRNLGGVKLFVQQVKANWSSREGFADVVKLFIEKYPHYFAGMAGM